MATLSHDELDRVYSLARVARRYDPGINDFYFLEDEEGKDHLVFHNTRRDLHVIVAEVVPQHMEMDAAHGRLEAFRYFPERNTFRKDYGASDNLLMHRCYQAYDLATDAIGAPFRWLAECMTPRPAAAGHTITFPHHVPKQAMPKPAAAKPAPNAHYHAHGHAPAHPSGKPQMQLGQPTKQPDKPRDSRRMM